MDDEAAEHEEQRHSQAGKSDQYFLRRTGRQRPRGVVRRRDEDGGTETQAVKSADVVLARAERSLHGSPSPTRDVKLSQRLRPTSVALGGRVINSARLEC